MSQLTIDTHQHLWNLDRVAYPWLVPAYRADCADVRAGRA